MKICSWKIWTFEVPLSQSLSTKPKLDTKEFHFSKRNGLLLQLQFSDKSLGWGEIMPLPGVHRETINQCLTALLKILPNLVGQKINPSHAQIEAPFFNLFADLPIILFPTIQFGIESCLLQFILDHEKSVNYRAAGLIFLEKFIFAENRMQLNNWIKNKCTCIKVKVGDLSWSQVEHRLASITNYLPTHIKLRLDDLAKWNDSNHISNTLLPKEITDRVEFWEESKSVVETPSQKQAVDESTWSIHDPFIVNLPTKIQNADFIVLKPSCLGGFSATARWVRWATQYNKQVVLSSCFESGLSLSYFIRWSDKFEIKNDLGIGTYSYMPDDILRERIKKIPGHGSLKTPVSINFESRALRLLNQSSND